MYCSWCSLGLACFFLLVLQLKELNFKLWSANGFLSFDYLTFILIFELSTFFSIYLLNPLLKNYNLTALYSSEFYGFCKNMSIWKLWIFWFLDWRWRKKLRKKGKQLRPTPLACDLKIQGTLTSVYEVFV